MYKIGEIKGFNVFLEQVPASEQDPLHCQVGISCQVWVVKGPNTLFTLKDAVDHKFCFGDILDVFHKTNKNGAGKYFCPGFENYRFQGNGFGSNDRGQFVLGYIIRPVHSSFE